MCGITLNRTGIEPTKHRGIVTNKVQIGPWYLIHDWLPIQTRLGVDQPQPIEIHPGSFLAYNGEIFDYPINFKNDTDYLVQLVRTMGFVDAMDYIGKRHDGFWSAVYVNEKRVFAATDPWGKKQLYMNRNGEICSEIRGVKNEHSKVVGTVFDEVARQGFTNKDLYSNIHKLTPGWVYMDGVPTKAVTPPLEFWSDLRLSLSKSVRRRLMGLEDIAIFVSGGLDSSIIAYLASKITDRDIKIKLYSIENSDDDAYVDLLEDFLDKGINRLKVSPLRQRMALEANELPFDMGSMISNYLLFESVAEKVILTGDGADELFGGYRRNEYFPTLKMDLFELEHYHLPRIDRMAGWFTKEARQPFLSRDVYGYARTVIPKVRGKKVLKEIFSNELPKEILDRPKHPLKSTAIRVDEKQYRYNLLAAWLEMNKLEME